MGKLNHPAGISTNTYWFGVECEGRHSGKKTVFLTGEVSAADLEKILLSGIEHIFLCEDFSAWDWFEKQVLPLVVPSGLSIVHAVYLKNVETILKLPFASMIMLMVRIQSEKFMEIFGSLRDSDEVSIGGPYHLATASVLDFVRTTPDGYTKDHL